MTPEEAYWHACTNTPIDEGPARPALNAVFWDPMRSLQVFRFVDGTLVSPTDPVVPSEGDSYGHAQLDYVWRTGKRR